ncbi:MAG: ribosomal protein S18-alanine N-acetyltransferase [Gammaproteobacteria bacterium]|nr:ribosomal protein S18-alanine N-acetyltransferase [Gammaproteobacteria bacterium]
MSAVLTWPIAALRKIRESDLPSIIAIEQVSYDFPWTNAIFRDCMRVGYHCQVYDSARGVLGYGIMSLRSGECHLLNLCIHPDFRTRGLGSQLIGYLLDVASSKNAGIALLEVRISNHAAHRLYTRMGFNEIGLRKNYYPARRGREDALVLARDLGDGLGIVWR